MVGSFQFPSSSSPLSGRQRRPALTPMPEIIRPESKATSQFTRLEANGAAIIGAKFWGQPPSRLLLATPSELFAYQLPRPDRTAEHQLLSVDPFYERIYDTVFSRSGGFMLEMLTIPTRHARCLLYEYTEIGYMADTPPLLPIGVQPLAVSDCAGYVAARTARNKLSLFSRFTSIWRESSQAILDQEKIENCQFSWDARHLLVQATEGVTFILRREGNPHRWVIEKRLDPCWSASLLEVPFRVFARVPCSSSRSTAAFFTPPESTASGELSPTSLWPMTLVGPEVCNESIAVAKDGRALARIFRAAGREDRGAQKSAFLIKIAFVETDDPPVLFRVENVCFGTIEEPFHTEWSQWNRPLLVYQKNSFGVHLIQLFDGEEHEEATDILDSYL